MLDSCARSLISRNNSNSKCTRLSCTCARVHCPSRISLLPAKPVNFVIPFFFSKRKIKVLGRVSLINRGIEFLKTRKINL